MKKAKAPQGDERPKKSVRLDSLLVTRSLFATRSRAADAVRRGTVRVDGKAVRKAGALVDEGASLEVVDVAAAYVSRAALKLIHALDTFAFDPRGRVCLDLGASTGGFTQVLLGRGAARVYAVDVGHGQFHASLKEDPRVVLLEGINARELDAGHVPEAPTAIVADVSFISLRLALPPALALAGRGCWAVLLFKPQFEMGRDALGKGGIVRDPAAAESAARDFCAWLDGQGGWRVAGMAASPIAGADGNLEFLIGVMRRDGAQ